MTLTTADAVTVSVFLNHNNVVTGMLKGSLHLDIAASVASGFHGVTKPDMVLYLNDDDVPSVAVRTLSHVGHKRSPPIWLLSTEELSSATVPTRRGLVLLEWAESRRGDNDRRAPSDDPKGGRLSFPVAVEAVV